MSIVERDLFKAPLTAEEIRQMLGDRPPSDLLSTKSPRFKELGLVGKSLSPDEMIRLMATEPYLVRRPSFLVEDRLVVGLDTEKLDTLL